MRSSEKKLQDIAYFHWGMSDNPDNCGNAECDICAMLLCPHGEPFHFHHDGCPACGDTEPQLCARDVIGPDNAGMMDRAGTFAVKLMAKLGSLKVRE